MGPQQGPIVRASGPKGWEPGGEVVGRQVTCWASFGQHFLGDFFVLF